MARCDSLYKYSVCVLNGVYFFFGSGAVGAGIWVLANNSEMNILSKSTPNANPQDFDHPSLLQNSAIIMMVGGVVLAVIGFLGCWGAMNEPKLMLFLYGTVLVLILILQMVAGILGSMTKEDFEGEFDEILIKNIEANYDGVHSSTMPFSQALDYAHVFFECCGILNSDEFKKKSWHWLDKMIKIVPESCCHLISKDDFYKHNTMDTVDVMCAKNPTANNSFVNKPCFEQIRTWFVRKANIVIAIAFTIVITEVIGMIVSCSILRTVLTIQGRL